MANTVSADVRKDASQAKSYPKTKKSLGQALTLEAMDRSLQKPVDPKKLIASKVSTAKLYRPCCMSHCTFGRPQAHRSVALLGGLGPREHLSRSPCPQAE